MATSYDLNEIADALAAVFDGLPTGDEFGGVGETFNAYAEVPGQIEEPAIVLELDDLSWDATMGAGEDTLTFLATVLVDAQDDDGSQRALRAFLSRDGGVGKLKAALLADQTLGGLVSYAHMPTVRRIGTITYGGVDYLGAELPIEIVSAP